MPKSPRLFSCLSLAVLAVFTATSISCSQAPPRIQGKVEVASRGRLRQDPTPLKIALVDPSKLEALRQKLLESAKEYRSKVRQMKGELKVVIKRRDDATMALRRYRSEYGEKLADRISEIEQNIQVLLSKREGDVSRLKKFEQLMEENPSEAMAAALKERRSDLATIDTEIEVARAQLAREQKNKMDPAILRKMEANINRFNFEFESLERDLKKLSRDRTRFAKNLVETIPDEETIAIGMTDPRGVANFGELEPRHFGVCLAMEREDREGNPVELIWIKEVHVPQLPRDEEMYMFRLDRDNLLIESTINGEYLPPESLAMFED